MIDLDETHDPALESWVRSANDGQTDFPIQNLPFGRFRLPGERAWRVGVAIGDGVLDLSVLGLDAPADMAELLDASLSSRVTLRHQLSRGLRVGAGREVAWGAYLHPMASVELGLPCEVGNYTDFYAGIHHAQNVGKLFRPDAPLLPNYRWVPIAYHGRASTIVPSGRDFKRPRGQIKRAECDAPVLAPTERLDFELEMGIVIGRGSLLGEPIALTHAEEHIFGLTLLNDWSARDIQAWEYQPLGPFLAKNFATTLSPWMVTLEALAPYRSQLVRPEDAPPSLDYLESAENRRAGAFDVSLRVLIQSAAMRAQGLPPHEITASNFALAAWWTPAQMVCHHTVNGCALVSGDVLGSGTLSGPDPRQAGSLLELASTTPVVLPSGETRRFLEDGDRVVLMGHCAREGFRRIGFGGCEAVVLPA